MRTPADQVGLTDKAPTFSLSADQVGLTDTVASALVHGATGGPDQVGLTDAVTAKLTVSRTVADQVGITDAEAVYGLITQVLGSTAEADVDSTTGMRDVVRLRGTAAIDLDFLAPNLTRGLTRAVIEVAASADLTHVTALNAEANAELSMLNPRLRVVRRLTDVTTAQQIPVAGSLILRNGPIYAAPQTSWPTGTTFTVAHGGYNSVDGSITMFMQADRNLVIYDNSRGGVAVWSSGTFSSTQSNSYTASFDSTGTLRIIAADGTTVVWSSGSGGAGATLYLGTDGTLFITRADGSVAWTSTSGSTVTSVPSATGGLLPGALGPSGKPVWRLVRNPAVPVGWGALIAADLFDDVPAGAPITIAVWMRFPAGTTVAPEIVTDPAGNPVAALPTSAVGTDAWQLYTATVTTAVDWVAGFQRFRAGVGAYLDWSDPTVTVAQPMRINLDPTPAAPPRVFNRIARVLR